MINQLTHVCIPVKNYDEAMKWYTEKLGFEIRSDETFGQDFRWVTLGAKGGKETEIVLYESKEGEADPRLRQVGQISGWIFGTDDCRGSIESLKNRGVNIVMEPNDAPWGTQACIEDLYGNSFLIVQARKFTKEELMAYQSV